eukprot:2806780-Pleurochrysis_carterae.AAC.2
MQIYCVTEESRLQLQYSHKRCCRQQCSVKMSFDEDKIYSATTCIRAQLTANFTQSDGLSTVLAPS